MKKQKGFTLIEAMIAVVVFSFGLLGVAGVMLVAVKSNHNGYMRTQATFLAHSIVESMRSNSWAVWNNVYNGTYQGYSSTDGMCTTNACSCTAAANRDTQKWSNMITNTLTNGQGEIDCDSSGAYAFACGESDQPYLGFCTITITWNESNETSAVSEQSVTVVSGP
ncbi:MAG: type IV pilus modification protein PilV [Marinicellaceae bacterium]